MLNRAPHTRSMVAGPTLKWLQPNVTKPIVSDDGSKKYLMDGLVLAQVHPHPATVHVHPSTVLTQVHLLSATVSTATMRAVFPTLLTTPLTAVVFRCALHSPPNFFHLRHIVSC